MIERKNNLHKKVVVESLHSESFCVNVFLIFFNFLQRIIQRKNHAFLNLNLNLRGIFITYLPLATAYNFACHRTIFWETKKKIVVQLNNSTTIINTLSSVSWNITYKKTHFRTKRKIFPSHKLYYRKDFWKLKIFNREENCSRLFDRIVGEETKIAVWSHIFVHRPFNPNADRE